MKQKDTTLVYDGSFNGFLSAVFAAFEQKLKVADIISIVNMQAGLFSDVIQVDTDESKAKRVWFGVQRSNPEMIKNIYFAFLSEANGIEILLYNYIRQIVLNNTGSEEYCSKENLAKIRQLAKLVGREKKRLESATELQSVYKDLRLAYIEPDFNVLPLLSRFFRSCYKNGDWIIFDLKRKYGIYCSEDKVQLVPASFVGQKIRQMHLNEGDEQLVSDKGLDLENMERKSRSSMEYPVTPTAA